MHGCKALFEVQKPKHEMNFKVLKIVNEESKCIRWINARLTNLKLPLMKVPL